MVIFFNSSKSKRYESKEGRQRYGEFFQRCSNGKKKPVGKVGLLQEKQYGYRGYRRGCTNMDIALISIFCPLFLCSKT